jgi:hypothetical protein
MSADRPSDALVALWCRELGLLLDLEVPVLAALQVVAEEIEPLAEVSVSLEVEVRGGDSLARCIARRDLVFPALVRSTVLAGDAYERLPEALLGAAGCLERAAAIGVERTGREVLAELAERAAPAPAVETARELLLEAIEMDAREVRVRGGVDGGRVEAELGGAWRVIREVEPDLFGPLCRRFKLMANIPYWIAEPSVGTIHLVTDAVGDWDVAVRAIPGPDGVDQSIDLTLLPRNGEPADHA